MIFHSTLVKALRWVKSSLSKDKKDKMQTGVIFGSLTRLENIKIHIELDHEEYRPVADLIEQICGWATSPESGDTVKFDYEFSIEYFGNVERNLDKVLTILSHAETAVIDVDSELIDGVTCLIARVVEKLRQVQTMIPPRQG